MYKIMLVDDEPLALLGMEEIIDWNAEGFTVVASCSSGTEALEQAENLSPDAVVTDIRIPDMTGIELLEKIRKIRPQTEFFVVSAYSDFEMAREAIRLAALDYVLKPLSEEEFLKAAGCMRNKLDQKTEKERKSSRFGSTKRIRSFRHIRAGEGAAIFFWHFAGITCRQNAAARHCGAKLRQRIASVF